MTVELHLGDCLEILQTMPAKSVDAIITDLPYGTTACKWDEIIPFAPMWEQVKRVLKPRGVFVTTASQPFTSKLVMSNPGWFRYECIWEKNKQTGFMNAGYMPLKIHENILVFSSIRARANQFTDEKMTYNPQGIIESGRKQKGKSKESASNNMRGNVNKEYVQRFTNYPTTIFRVNKDCLNLHPTQKPVALYEYLIRTYTNEGDTVLDICAGSGTTGIAAMNTGRNAILIEKEPKYFEIIQRRIAEAQPSLLVTP